MKYSLIVVALIIIAVSIFALRYRQRQSAGGDVNKSMVGLANRAVERAKQEFATNLDYSPSSVKQVEEILGKLHERQREQAFSERQLTEEATTWGAYIGEVGKRIRTGSWKRDSPVAGQGALPLVYDDQEVYLGSWVYGRIVNGDEDNVWNKFQRIYFPENFKRIDIEEMLKQVEGK